MEARIVRRKRFGARVGQAELRGNAWQRSRWTLRLSALLVVLSLAGCGSQPEGEASQGSAEAWPLSVEAEGVLAYAAVVLPAVEGRAALDELFGASLAGLNFDRHFVALHLDERVFGGGVSFALPVDDPDAFRESFERSPYIESLGGNQFRMHLPADHKLARALSMARGGASFMTGGLQPSSIAQLGQMFSSAAIDFPIRLSMEADSALLAPSLEGVIVTRRMLAEVPGLQQSEGPALIASLNVERFKDRYYEELERLTSGLRAALLGVKLVGFAGLMHGMLDGAGEPGASGLFPELPVPPAALWSFLELLGPKRVEALGFRLESLLATNPSDAAADSRAGFSALQQLASADAEWLLRYAPDAPEQHMLNALRPAPVLKSVNVVLHADAGLFAPALSDWMRPLAELAAGDGTAAEAWQQELVSLIAAWDGRLLATCLPSGEFVLLLGTHPHGEWDLPAMESWARPLADALQLDLPGHEVWQAQGNAERVGNFTVLSGAAVNSVELDRLLLAVEAADWSGEDTSQPALRAFAELKASDSEQAPMRFQFDLGRDPELGFASLHFAPPAAN